MTGTQQNRLSGSHSPYLLMHASNPVDWYPWGDEAFKEAHSRDLPIFLSIGYAACHWCHVMEQECFSDTEVAEILNNQFICIKVDREERPDIDQVYMTVCQIMTGSGGWPMSIFLNPEREPFYAATYIPKNGRPGMPGMMELIPYLANIWKNRREEVNTVGKNLIHTIKQVSVQQSGEFSEDIIHDAYSSLVSAYDYKYGGFSNSPKFPSIPHIFFLFRYYYYFSDKKAWEMADHTLMQMAVSGIRDHLDGGFHRYATDRAWKLPHFEKMLYDQALLALAYIEGYQISNNSVYKTTAKGILDYVCKNLTDPQGGFWSSVDADSPGGEGAYYLWKYDEVIEVLGKEDGIRFCSVYGIIPDGNVSGQGILKGSNVLHPGRDPVFIMKEQDVHKPGLPERWFTRMHEKMLGFRKGRSSPAIDDKILTDWNSLMISAFIQGYMTFGCRHYYDAAVRAATFILGKMILEDDGMLLHHWYHGKPGYSGLCSDYIFLSQALLDLFQADGNVTWINTMTRLIYQANLRFWSSEKNGYCNSDSEVIDLPVRLMDLMDNAVPSVNGAAALLLERLFLVTGDKSYNRNYDQLIRTAGGVSNRNYTGIISFMSAYLECQVGFRIIAMFPDKSKDIPALLSEMRRLFLPGKMIIPVPDPEAISSIIQEVKAYPQQPALYICGNGQCYPPVTSKIEFELWKKNVIAHLK